MKTIFFSLLIVVLFGAIPFVTFAKECSTSTDIGKTYCTCDDGESSEEIAGSSFDSDSCNSACLDAGASSWTLETCDSPDEVNPGFSTENQSNVIDDSESSADDEVVGGTTEAAYIVPILNIQIPGFSGFTQPTKSADGTYVSVNFIAEYVNAAYSWLLGAGALVAVVMMMVGGLQYLLSRGKPKYIEKAKTRITNAITGVVLLLAAFNIAYLINPDFTQLDSLNVTNVQGLEYFPPEGEDDNITPNLGLSGDTSRVLGDHISAYSGATLEPDTLAALQDAASNFYSATKKNIVIASATRDLNKQATLFYNNCLAQGGVCSPVTCNPSSGVVSRSGSKYTVNSSFSSYTGTALISELVSHANLGNCPHTSTIAVDAWCDDGGTNYRHDPTCQGQLISAMISAGFCRLTSEPWHFELNSKKVSTACSTANNSISYTTRSGTHNPGSDCAKWDFKSHFCAVKK